MKSPGNAAVLEKRREERDINAGAVLVQALLRTDFRLEAAYWEDCADANEWRPVTAWKWTCLSPDGRNVAAHSTIISPQPCEACDSAVSFPQTPGDGLYVYHFEPKTFFSIADQLDRSVLLRS